MRKQIGFMLLLAGIVCAETAPEIIRVDGKDYIAGYGVGANIGIRIRPLHWSSADALKK